MGWKSRQLHILKKLMKPVTQEELEVLNWQRRAGKTKGEDIGSTTPLNSPAMQGARLEASEGHAGVAVGQVMFSAGEGEDSCSLRLACAVEDGTCLSTAWVAAAWAREMASADCWIDFDSKSSMAFAVYSSWRSGSGVALDVAKQSKAIARTAANDCDGIVKRI